MEISKMKKGKGHVIHVEEFRHALTPFDLKCLFFRVFDVKTGNQDKIKLSIGGEELRSELIVEYSELLDQDDRVKILKLSPPTDPTH